MFTAIVMVFLPVFPTTHPYAEWKIGASDNLKLRLKEAHGEGLDPHLIGRCGYVHEKIFIIV